MREINKTARKVIDSVLYAVEHCHKEEVFFEDYFKVESLLMEIATAGKLAEHAIDLMYSDGLEKEGVRRKEL